MSQSAIVGYPRVGSQRELKFWTEDYFRGGISAESLRRNAAGLRQKQWLTQKQNGIDFIPSNDFSFYDGVLDTACLLDAIPQSYRALGLDELSTYFAMARGLSRRSRGRQSPFHAQMVQYQLSLYGARIGRRYRDPVDRG